MSAFDTHPQSLAEDSATLLSQGVWKAAGRQDLDFESQRLRNRLRAKMFGVDAAPLKIGRYTVLETVGSGGMGVVYAAYDDQLDRRVAVKLLRGGPSDDASVGRGRLLREAQALAKLSHPNVVQVYEVGTFDDRVFLAMEFLSGPTLRAWLLDEPRDWQMVLGHFVDAGRGLAAAHQHGLIHRDFKPANLLFGGDGRIRVVDFGLARATDERRLELVGPESAGRGDPWPVELTQTGEIMGTPAYMSPEQATHHAVDARSDQYSFCVALYEALFGRRPHAGRSSAEVLVAIAEGRVESPPRNHKIPARIVRAIMRGLSTEPADRFPGMEALLAELALAKRTRWRLVGGGLAVVAGLAALSLTPEDVCPTFDASAGRGFAADVTAAFVATGAPGAAEAAERALERVEGYAAEWRQAREEVCEAHHVRRDLSAALHDEQVACLAERDAELAALVRVFAEADHAVIDRAPLAAAELTPIAECRRGPSAVEPARPSSTEHAELRLQLAAAQAQYKAGRYETALAIIDAVVGMAGELEAPGLQAAGLLHRGLIHERRRAYEPAIEALARAAELAEAGGDDELAARAWVHLARGQAMLDRIALADQGAGVARSKARRLADEALAQEAAESQAVVAWQAGRFDEALVQQRTVVDWYHRTYGGDHPYTAEAELRYASMLGDSGRHDEAQAGYARAREVLTGVFGPQHPALARVWFESGLDHQAAGQLDEARRAHAEADRLFRASSLADGPEALAVNNALVQLAIERGDLDEAQRRAERSVELAARVDVPARERLDVLGLEVSVIHDRGDHAHAIDRCRAYFELLASMPADPDLEVQALFVRAILAVALEAEGQHDEADSEARELLDALARRPADVTFAGIRAHAWLVAGRASEVRGEREPAAAAYRAGLESIAAADPASADVRALRARLQWGLVRATTVPATADRTLVLAAREALAEAEPGARELVELDAWLRAMG